MALHGYLVNDKYVVIAANEVAALLHADGAHQTGFDDVTIREVPDDFVIWGDDMEGRTSFANFTVAEAIRCEYRTPIAFRIQPNEDTHATPY